MGLPRAYLFITVQFRQEAGFLSEITQAFCWVGVRLAAINQPGKRD